MPARAPQITPKNKVNIYLINRISTCMTIWDSRAPSGEARSHSPGGCTRSVCECQNVPPQHYHGSVQNQLELGH